MRRVLAQVPLRWQLAILYVAILGAVLGLLGLLLFTEVDRILVTSVDKQLQDDATLMVKSGQLQEVTSTTSGRTHLRITDGMAKGVMPPMPGPLRALSKTVSATPTPVPPPSSDASPPTAANLGLDRLVNTDVAVRFVGGDGKVLAQTGTPSLLDGMPVPDSKEITFLDSMARTNSYTVGQQPRRYDILLEPASTSTGVMGVLELGASLDQVDAFLRIFRYSLLVGVVAALGTGTVVGLSVTRRLLLPLDRMAAVSKTVAKGDLSRRFSGPTGSRDVNLLARNFNQMIDRLEESLRSQQRFTADAAHELRTPLTALGGSVELLLLGADEGDPERVQKVLRTMDLELQRLTRLVNDLLQLSRMEGQMQLHVAPLDVAALTAEVAGELRLVGPHAVVEFHGDGPLPVVGDCDKLKQVLLNVGDNALKFTPPGGLVTLSALRAGSVARLRITDSGPGIPSPDLPHIFDRFYRSDSSRSRGSGGMGLGLAIAKAIVEAHRGAIVAVSPAGRGATFIVDLPLQVEATPALPKPAITRPAPAKPAVGRGDRRNTAAPPALASRK